MPVLHIPDGFHTVTPFLSVSDLERTLGFLSRVFDAQVTALARRPDGSPWHAELRIGDSMVMVSRAREASERTGSAFYLYLPDCRQTWQRAVEAGAVSLMEPTETFYGNLESGVRDGDGTSWWLATRIREVTREELERRAREQPIA